MAAQKIGRRRGAILTARGFQKLQAARQEQERVTNFGDRYSREELCEVTKLSLKTIAKIFGSNPDLDAESLIPVDRQTLKLCFTSFNLLLERGDYLHPDLDSSTVELPQRNNSRNRRQSLVEEIFVRTVPKSPLLPHQICPQDSAFDCGEAPDISNFHGRETELSQLVGWVNVDRCRLVDIVGMGGIGKTALVTKLAQQLQPNFSAIVWRSLRNAPLSNDLLPEIIQVFSHYTETVPATMDISTQISHLFRHLCDRRCLLILDNVEAILPQNTTDRERDPGYTELFRRMGESPHQSCLILTSREKPEVIAPLEGLQLFVRTFTLNGLNASESEYLFDAKQLSGSRVGRARLRELYSGNPLALNIIATSICDLFDGEIDEFLAEGVSMFGGIRQILQQQFDRLRPAEQQLMYWFAIERVWISPSELQSQIVPATTKPRLFSTLESLSRKSLIERSGGKFTQQAVVMEYMTERLIDLVVKELTNWDLQAEQPPHLPIWLCYPLRVAQSPKYIYEIQTRLILESVASQLQLQFGHKLALVRHLRSIIVSLQTHYRGVLHYGGGNIIHLLRSLDIDLTGSNFANLPIRQVNFQDVILHDVDFSGADFHDEIFTHYFGGIFAVAFSPNSQLIAAAEYNGTIYIGRVADKRIPFLLRGHTNWIWSVAFSPDGQILASASQDATVRLWDVATGRTLHILQADNYHVMSLSFSPAMVNLPSGAAYVLATAHGDGAIRLWNSSTGELMSERARHAKQAFSVRFSPDGRCLASGSDDCTVKIWDAATGECLHTLTEHTKRIWSVRFSPDGKLLATCSGDGTIRIWDTATWTGLDVLTGYHNWVFAIEFSPDSQMLAVGNIGNAIAIWNIRTKQQIASLHRHTTWVATLQFSPNGRFLVSGSGDRSICLWDTQTWQELYRWQGYSNWIESVMFHPAGTKLIAGGHDGMVREWDVQTHQILQTFTGHQMSIWSIDYSPDGKSMVSGSADGTVKLWDAATGNSIETFSAQPGEVWKVQFSPDGRLIAGVGLDNTGVCLWLVTGELFATLIGHTNVVRSLAFSPDSQILATASFDACWRLWDVNTGKLMGCYAGHTNWIWDVTFSPDGRCLASCSADLTARLWDVATGKLLQTFEGHTLEVHTVKFSPNGQYLATGSADRTIKIWEIETGKVVQTLTGHRDRVLSVSYSPDGRILASGSGDGTFKLWHLATGECTATCQPLPPNSGMKITGATGLTPATIGSLKMLGAIIDPIDSAKES
jgi:WD40 repeat protein/ABC-type dipeptide/oligopeptide/nickel transport system ATPase subunit